MKKNLFKKFAYIAMSAVMVFGIPLTASAQETETPSYSVTINEYDIYVDTRIATTAELARSGVNYETVSIIKSDSIEDELTRLSALAMKYFLSLGTMQNKLQFYRIILVSVLKQTQNCEAFLLI